MSEYGRRRELAGLLNEGASSEFQKQMDKYIKALTTYHNGYFKKEYPNVPPPSFEAQYGKVRVKVVRIDGLNGGKSVHCFVDFNGEVLKAAGWNAPAKGSRGNIFDAPSKWPLDGRDFYRR